MTATVIIIGYNTTNKLNAALTVPEASLITRRGPCSPSCDQTKAVVVVPPVAPATTATLAYANTREAKPAEAYVFEFASEANARSWLEAAPREELMSKIVLLIEPLPPA